MSEENKPLAEGVEAKPLILSVDVKLGTTGEVVTVRKLKAGPYYEAQKVYVDWISKIQKLFAGNQEDLQEAVDANGKVDEKKLAEQLKKSNSKVDVAEMLSIADNASANQRKLLSLCLGQDEKIINDNYYPEDLEQLLTEVIKLNNFMENVKKSVAPMVGGA